MQEETKKRSSQSLQARLNFGPEDEVSPPRHRKERRGKDNRRPPVFGRIGKQVLGTQTANLQNLDTHENNDRRISVRDRLGSRDVHSRLGQWRSPSESPPSSDSEDSRRPSFKEKAAARTAEKDTQTTGYRNSLQEAIHEPERSKNFPKTTTNAHSEGTLGKGYCEFHRQKGHISMEWVKLRQLIDKLVKEGVWKYLVKNSRKGKIITKGAEARKSTIGQVVEPLTIEINAAGHDIHRMYIDGGASADILAIRLPLWLAHKETHKQLDEFYGDQITSPFNGLLARQGSQRYGGPYTATGANIPHSEIADQSDNLRGATSSGVTGLKLLSTTGDRLESGVLMRIPLKVLIGCIIGYQPKSNGIRMREQTAFNKSKVSIAYTKMPFGLKNAEPDGIKPCPEKTKAVIQLPSPRTMKEVQSLNGKLAGLNRFLSKSADKSLPLFKTLKKCTKKGDFRWTTAAEEAFTQLKQHIAALPTLVAPRPGEELIMYLSATHGAISAVLLTDRDSVQTPVYFVSKALKETEINYSAMEKNGSWR
ncbi:reverse transcriptase domain-containing protein [Tanacetum coccineum]